MIDGEATRRTALFALLYAAEGAPIGFIWWALPTVLRTADVPVERITALTAVLVLPWTFKFLWAPLVDRLRWPRWGFRGWIATMQVGMAGCLVPLIWLDPVLHFDAWRLLLLAHACAAATQDVAVDAFAIAIVPSRDRGRLNGAMQAGMLAGRSLFGGGALLVLAALGHQWILLALVAWVLLVLVAVAALDVEEPPLPSAAARDTFLHDLTRVAARPSTWWGLAFAVSAAAAFEATGQLAGPYLVDRGASTAVIGLFFGVVVVAAMIGGGLAGGRLSDRWGRAPSCAVFLLGFVGAILLLGAADVWAPSPAIRFGLLGLMYLFVGLFTAASYALFMDLSDPALGGTQFSAFMSGTNACESWAAWTGGRIAGAAGYPAAFVVMSLASLASLPLLARLGRATTRSRRTAPPTSPS